MTKNPFARALPAALLAAALLASAFAVPARAGGANAPDVAATASSAISPTREYGRAGFMTELP